MVHLDLEHTLSGSYRFINLIYIFLYDIKALIKNKTLTFTQNLKKIVID